ncbi:hypothetical protein ACDX78_21175 [Virgibacillus oceani]
MRQKTNLLYLKKAMQEICQAKLNASFIKSLTISLPVSSTLILSAFPFTRSEILRNGQHRLSYDIHSASFVMRDGWFGKRIV